MRRIALTMGLLAACGGANSEALALQQVRLARAKHQEAAKSAPELFGRFEATQQTASKHPSDSAARRDYESEARLWLEAAISEAERIHLSEARQSVERETAAFDATALEHDRARVELAERAEREAAREVVRRESELALARAALAPQQRVKLGRAEVEQAAQALIARAALVQLALLSWDISAQALAPLEAKLTRARAVLAKNPDEALLLADDTLFSSLGLLGDLRRAAEGVSDPERASLMEALTQSGAQVARNDRGLAAFLPQPFVGARLQPASERLLAHLCSLAQGHPHGPVQITLSPSSGALAESRAHALREPLTRLGCAGPRFRVDATQGAPGRAVGGSADVLELTWLAY